MRSTFVTGFSFLVSQLDFISARPSEAMSESMSWLHFNKAQWAWILYDLGSFGFGTVTVGTYMPIFFKVESITATGGYSPSLTLHTCFL